MFAAFAVASGGGALGEVGDQTQLLALLLAVTLGTTLGMPIANVPVVLLGERALRALPVAWVHRIAAAAFALLGVAVLLGVG